MKRAPYDQSDCQILIHCSYVVMYNFDSINKHRIWIAVRKYAYYFRPIELLGHDIPK